MRRVGVRELRQNASQLLACVAAGESIEVTDRGRPVARLVPIPEPTGWDALVAAGRVRPPERDTHNWPAPMPLLPGSRPPGKILEEMRKDER